MDVLKTFHKFLPLGVTLIVLEDRVFLTQGLTKVEIKNKTWTPYIERIFTILEKGVCASDLHIQYAADNDQVAKEVLDFLLQTGLLPASMTKPTNQNRPLTPEDLFYSQLGCEPDLAKETLAKTKITLISINEFTHALSGMLKKCGLQNVTLTEEALASIAFPGECIVAISPFNNRYQLKKINAHCLQKKIHFYPILINNVRAYLGPYIDPSTPGPCFECLCTRFISNLSNPIISLLDDYCDRLSISSHLNGYHPCMIDAVASFACMNLINNILNLPRRSIGQLTNLCLLTQEATPFKIMKAPSCKVCHAP